MNRNHKLIFGAAALLAAAGGGVAIAASDSSASQESQAVIDDAAQKLGISSSKLSSALKQALVDRVDAAVAAGRITKAEGDVLKQRINADAFPIFPGPARGFDHHGGLIGKLDAAAGYLGVTEDQLRTELQGGKTLAQVAQAHGKTAAGLVEALVAAAKQHLDADVAAGRLTQAQADQMLSGLRDRITGIVNGRFPSRPAFGFRHFRGPTA
jgi:hypothetical protein